MIDNGSIRWVVRLLTHTIKPNECDVVLFPVDHRSSNTSPAFNAEIAYNRPPHCIGEYIH